MTLKKELLICVVIILIIIFNDFILNNHFRLEKEDLEIEVSKLQEIILNNDNGKEKIDEIDNKWKDFEKIAAYYTEHNELEKISLKVDLVKKLIETDQNDMTIEYLEEIKFWLNHIFEKDKFKLKNIF